MTQTFSTAAGQLPSTICPVFQSNWGWHSILQNSFFPKHKQLEASMLVLINLLIPFSLLNCFNISFKHTIYIYRFDKLNQSLLAEQSLIQWAGHDHQALLCFPDQGPAFMWPSAHHSSLGTCCCVGASVPVLPGSSRPPPSSQDEEFLPLPHPWDTFCQSPSL